MSNVTFDAEAGTLMGVVGPYGAGTPVVSAPHLTCDGGPEALWGRDANGVQARVPDPGMTDQSQIERAMRRLPPTAVEDLSEIVMNRYDKGSIIMTTNRPLEDWGQVLGDTAISGTTLDRFLVGTRSWRTAV